MTITVNSKASLQGIVTLAGSGALLKFYTSPQPSAGATATGTLLGTLTGSSTLGVITDGGTQWVLTFNSVASDTEADNTGTAAWARLTSSSGEWIADLDVAASGAALTLAPVDIIVNGIINFTSGTITVPKP